MSYRPSIVRETDPGVAAPPWIRAPRGILPACDARLCTFRIQEVGETGDPIGFVLEHHDATGQMQGKMLTRAEVEDASVNLWGIIKPFYLALHDEDSA